MANSNYFKPYKHPDSGSMFHENGSYEQSLFSIAISEQKRIFSKQVLVNPPDILLSLGSGYEPGRRDSAQPSPITKDINGRGAEEASRESWHDFLASLSADALLNRFMRIDPAISNLPARDDLDSLELLQSVPESYFDTEEIRKIAFRLFANLFYFEEQEEKGERLDDENGLQGIVKTGIQRCAGPLIL
jgi:hypothetical protein